MNVEHLSFVSKLMVGSAYTQATIRDIFALKENVPQVYTVKVRFSVTFLFKRDGTFFNYMVGPDF